MTAAAMYQQEVGHTDIFHWRAKNHIFLMIANTKEGSAYIVQVVLALNIHFRAKITL